MGFVAYLWHAEVRLITYLHFNLHWCEKSRCKIFSQITNLTIYPGAEDHSGHHQCHCVEINVKKVILLKIPSSLNNYSQQYVHYYSLHACLLSRATRKCFILIFDSQSEMFVPHRVKRLGFDFGHLDISRSQHFLDTGALL